LRCCPDSGEPVPSSSTLRRLTSLSNGVAIDLQMGLHNLHVDQLAK
jgi:phage baseplate assembly protein gpV